MEIPLWMATAIYELGLTKEDFDAFFTARTICLGDREERHKKRVDRVVASNLGDDLYRAFLAAPWSQACGDDGVFTICDED